MSTKQHPGAFDCYAKLADDEPYFVLRAKDASAPAIMREWVRQQWIAWFDDHGSEPVPPTYKEKLLEASACAARMEQWRREHIT